MSTCQQSIANTPISNISEVVPNTLFPFEFGVGNNKLFKLIVGNFQTKTFNVSLIPIGAGTINVSVSIFRIDSQVTLIGNVQLQNLNTNFIRDFSVGTYIICIRTNNTLEFAATIFETAIGFPGSANLNFTIFQGQELSFDLTISRPPRVCTEPLFFEIIDGSLPPGLVLTPLGRIEGFLPDLDCIDTENEYSPSFNWLYENDGSYFPWARQWRFKVRVQVSDNIRAIAEEWFCIRIVNNWSKDRDNFLKQMPFIKTETIEVLQPPKTIPKTLCIEKCEEPVLVKRLQPIIPLCDSCEEISQIPIREIRQAISEPILINGRNPEDIDQMLLNWMFIENQKNPITAEGFNGTQMEFTLS